MKVKLFILLAIAGIICAAGCQNKDEDFAIKGNKTTSKAQSTTITAEEAKEFAAQFLSGLLEDTRSQSKSIGEVKAWLSDDLASVTRSSNVSNLPDTLMYIVNLQDEDGYFIIAAEREQSGVLAYVEDGNLQPTEEIDNPGFQLFLDGAIKHITSPRTIEYTPPLAPHPTGPITYIKPLFIRTKWHQRSPFNDNCPLQNGSHTLAGCGPIATAQVVAYFKSPANFNGYNYHWDSIYVNPIPNNNTGRTDAAHLVRTIGNLESANYGLLGTGVNHSAIGTCLDALGYQYSTASYSYFKFRNSIRNNRPVIVTGFDYNHMSGHAWVIDGLYEFIITRTETLGDGTIISFPEETDYVHCNWGWGGNCNGYFFSGAFDTQEKQYEDDFPTPASSNTGSVSYDFSDNLNIYYDICPN